MCPFMTSSNDITTSIIWYGIKIFLLIWIVFVPIAITARLEKIIKLLEQVAKS